MDLLMLEAFLALFAFIADETEQHNGRAGRPVAAQQLHAAQLFVCWHQSQRADSTVFEGIRSTLSMLMLRPMLGEVTV